MLRRQFLQGVPAALAGAYLHGAEKFDLLGMDSNGRGS